MQMQMSPQRLSRTRVHKIKVNTSAKKGLGMSQASVVGLYEKWTRNPNLHLEDKRDSSPIKLTDSVISRHLNQPKHYPKSLTT